MVPDFRLEMPTLPSPTGGMCQVLAELKVISSCPTRYIPGSGVRAVDKRARELPGEYRRKARDVDRMYGGVAEGVVGPVERQLQQYGDLVGMVFGAFGEASQDVHELVQVLAESRLRYVGRQRGREGGEGELSVIVSQIRRRLSVAAVLGCPRM